MKTIIEILTDKVSEAFKACGYSKELGAVKVSDRPDLCQFQCNGAFSGAKLYKKAPMLISKEVTEKLQGDSIFSNLSVVGAGFINIDVKDSFLLDYVADILADDHLGIKQTTKDETIFLDYGGPNAAKSLHVGHLRSAIIGESLKRLANTTGRKTVSDVHLGDWGLQMGLVMAELEERGDYSLSGDEWSDIYPLASQKSKENEAFKQKAQDITAKFQMEDPKYYSLWKKIMEISVAEIKETYDLLGVSFDLWHGESDSKKYMDTLISILENKGLLVESLGAMVVDVSEPTDNSPIPPIIIKKSNGASGYATTDLATFIEREELCHPTELWYVVDNRQSLHFTQVFRCAKKASLVPQDTAIYHLGFGTMNGKDGKPYKTRDGEVMKLRDFYNTVYDTVFKRVEESSFSDGTDKKDIAHKITIAAMKFGDLMNHRSKNYIFDIDKFTASEGKTGTFLLYTIARINSILKKVGNVTANKKADKIYSSSEKEILLTLALSNEAFELTYNEKAPNIICENAYKIASDFSKFYSENHIIGEQDQLKKSAWINLCKATKTILEKHLYILGIEPVEIM